MPGRLRSWALGAAPSGSDPAELPGVQDAPSRSEVQSYVAQLRSYAPAQPLDWEKLGPEAALAWTEQGIRNWARAQGVPLSETELQQAALGYAEQELGVSIPQNVAQAREVGLELAVTEACAGLGVDPQLGFVTYEALRDGRLDKGDCQAIGRASGAMAGAAIGQAYGIPAPIGAYVGGQLGGAVGSWFSDSFGIGGSAQQRRTQQLEARWEAIQAWFVGASRDCAELKQAVGLDHQRYVNELVRLWLKAELELGMRFDLRWFGRYRAFRSWAYTHQIVPNHCWVAHSPEGPRYFSSEAACQRGATTWCSQVPTSCTRHGVRCEAHEYRTILGSSQRMGEASGYYRTMSCHCEPAYGCRYPSVAGGREGEPVVVAQVYGYLGRPDLDPGCALEAPTEYYALDLSARNAWMGRVVDGINGYVALSRQLSVLYTQLLLDLLRTAAVVQGEREVAEQRLELGVSGTQTLRLAARRGKRKAALLNGGLLLVGLGAVGYALWRRRT
jgi:hypothetical protein